MPPARRPRPRASRTHSRGGAGFTAVAVAAVTVLAGCAIGPTTGPGLVPAGEGGGPAPASSSAPRQAPALQAPKNDLTWSDCGTRIASEYRTTAPRGITVECAELSAPVNPDRPQGGDLTVSLTRARAANTPGDAAPLVLTSGSDLPSSRTLMLFASGEGRGLLDSNPIVAVDRRGIPQSSPLDCLTRTERSVLADNGLAGNGSGGTADRRIDRLATSASSAADGCTETLSPNQLAFGIRDAAADIEALRIRWGVPHLGLIGVGEGSDVVLAYTSLYGGRAGRIVLDTPTPFGANARDTASGAATGVQAALRTFAQRCGSQPNCALGSNGTQTIADVLDKGRSGGLDGLSDTQVLAAITTGLAVGPTGADGIGDVATAIAAANRGDTRALAALAATASALRLTDGQLVARCNNVTGPVGQNEVAPLIDAWSKQNPLTGADAALSLMRCNGWAASPAVAPPNSFPVAPLVLNGSGDPINGGTGAAALNPMFAKASTRPVTVSWDGLGYSVLARSACAADVVGQYVERSPIEGPSERGCPA
ncbi:alpha/beta hydrolase [Gordonia sinesedis]